MFLIFAIPDEDPDRDKLPSAMHGQDVFAAKKLFEEAGKHFSLVNKTSEANVDWSYIRFKRKQAGWTTRVL